MIETIVLKSGKWEAEIAPSVGANIVRLQHDGKYVLRPLDLTQPLPESLTRYGAPLLLPVNRTAHGRFTFQGKEYQLPINDPNMHAHLHGYLLYRPFTLVSCSDTAAELSIENKGDLYPFPFIVTVRYTLTEKGLQAHYQIQNTGEGDMPFVFGLHTTFPEPEKFRVDIAQIQELDENRFATGRYLPLSQQDVTYTTGAVSKGQRITGFYKASGNKACLDDSLVYEATEGFDHWTVFNGGGDAGILCIEPQCGAVNGLNFEGGHAVLKRGESKDLVWNLYYV